MRVSFAQRAWLKQPITRLYHTAQRQFRDPFFLGILISVTVYSVYWSSLTIAKYYSLGASVYDLGLFAERIWIVTQPSLYPSPAYYLASLLAQPWSLIFSPLSLTHSYPVLLAVQSVALGSGAFAIYFLGVVRIQNRLISFFLSIAYLLYFPMAGVNWFDIHFQAFFIPLVIIGILAWQLRKFRWAIVTLLLAGATTYPYEAFVVLFAAVVLVESVVSHPIAREMVRQRKAAAVLIVAAVSYLVFQTAFGVIVNGGSYALSTAHAINVLPASVDVKIVTVLLILSPVAFLPILSPRFGILLGPFVYLSLWVGNPIYSFPSLFHLQYGSLFIPFVFIATIEAIASLPRQPRDDSYDSHRSNHRLRDFASTANSPRVKTTLLVLFLCTLLALPYQPYGPFNSNTTLNYDLQQSVAVNMTQYNNLVALVNLIPASEPYVLFQNDMPEVLPRPLPLGLTPLTSTITNWQSDSVQDAYSNSFPLTTSSGQIAHVPIQYALANPYSNPYQNGFFDAGPNPSISMYTFVQSMIQSGKYGLLGEAGGMLLLERDYHGPLKYYRPYQTTVSASQLYINGSGPVLTPVLRRYNLTNLTTAWFGPYVTLSPGVYRATYSMMVSNVSENNTMVLATTILGGSTTLGDGFLRITGANFTSPDSWETISYQFTANNTWAGIQFEGISASWQGMIAIRSVAIAQIGLGVSLAP